MCLNVSQATQNSTHKAVSEKTLNTHRIQIHTQNETQVSLFLVSSFVFCQAATHAQGERLLSDHSVGIIKKKQKNRDTGKVSGSKIN